MRNSPSRVTELKLQAEEALVNNFIVDIETLKGTIPLNFIKIKWRRPPNAPDSVILTYRILRSADDDIHHAQQIAIVRRCDFTDRHLPNPGHWFYWVIPVNTAGNGVVSNICASVAFW